MPAKLAASIRNINLTLFAAVAVSAWTGVLISLQILQERTLEETKTSNRALTQVLAKHNGSSARRCAPSTCRCCVCAMSGETTQKTLLPKSKKKFLFSQSILQVSITNINGWVVWNSTTGKTPVGKVNLSDREHFQIHKKRLADELFVDMPVLYSTSNQSTIQFTPPTRCDEP